MSKRLHNTRRCLLSMNLREIQARADRDRDHGIHPELETKEQLADRAIEGADDRAYLLFEIAQLRAENPRRVASAFDVLVAMAATAVAVIVMPDVVGWIVGLW